MPASSEAANTIRQLASEGVSQREIAARLGVSKGTVYGILRGEHGISERRAEQAQEHLRQGTQEQKYSARVVGPDGHTAEVEPTSKHGRDLLRQYMQEVDNFKRGRPSDLDRFAGKSVTIRTPEGRRQFRFVTDRDVIRDWANFPEDRQRYFGGEKGS